MKTLITVAGACLALTACSQETVTAKAVATATTVHAGTEKVYANYVDKTNANYRAKMAAHLLPDPRCDRYRQQIAATEADPQGVVVQHVIAAYEAAKRDNCRKPT